MNSEIGWFDIHGSEPRCFVGAEQHVVYCFRALHCRVILIGNFILPCSKTTATENLRLIEHWLDL